MTQKHSRWLHMLNIYIWRPPLLPQLPHSCGSDFDFNVCLYSINIPQQCRHQISCSLQCRVGRVVIFKVLNEKPSKAGGQQWSTRDSSVSLLFYIHYMDHTHTHDRLLKICTIVTARVVISCSGLLYVQISDWLMGSAWLQPSCCYTTAGLRGKQVCERKLCANSPTSHRQPLLYIYSKQAEAKKTIIKVFNQVFTSFKISSAKSM